MPGNSTIGTNLVDSLLSTVDDLRESLHTDFGVRQFRVYVVTQAWSGGSVGSGNLVETELEITPQPLVKPWRTRFELEPCGLDEAGLVTLEEVSLTYTEDQLMGSNSMSSKVVWRLRDAHGQSIDDTDWVLENRPFPDRVNTIGWIVNLKRAA